MQRKDIKVGSEYAVQVGYGNPTWRYGGAERLSRAKVLEIGENALITVKLLDAYGAYKPGKTLVLESGRKVFMPWDEFVTERDARAEAARAVAEEREAVRERAEKLRLEFARHGITASAYARWGEGEITLDLDNAEKMLALGSEEAVCPSCGYSGNMDAADQIG